MTTETVVKDATKWYFKPATLVVGFLCIGPFILPLVWTNSKFDTRKKVAISAAILIVSYLLVLLMAKSLQSLNNYYQQIFELLQEMG